MFGLDFSSLDVTTVPSDSDCDVLETAEASSSQPQYTPAMTVDELVRICYQEELPPLASADDLDELFLWAEKECAVFCCL